MTKAIKKGLLAVLLCVMAVATFGFANSFAKTANAEVSPTATAFINVMNDFTGEETTVILADGTKVEAMLNARTYAERLTADDKADADVAAAFAKYNAIWTNVFAKPQEIIDYHNKTMYDMQRTETVLWSQSSTYENILFKYESYPVYTEADEGEYVLVDVGGGDLGYQLYDEENPEHAGLTRYDISYYLDENQKAYVNAYTDDFKYEEAVTALFNALNVKIIEASQAIAAIEYFKVVEEVVEGEIVEVKQMVAGDTTGEIVYDSNTTIAAAKAKLDLIYSGVAYKDWDATEKAAISAYSLAEYEVDYLDVYDNAVEDFAALQAKADLVGSETGSIHTLYLLTQVNGYKKYDKNITETERDTTIQDVRAAYNALNDTETYGAYNDLRKLVANTYAGSDSSELEKMEMGLSAVNTAITTIATRIQDLINQVAVDSANGVYTAACKAILDDIATKLNAIEKYVQDNAAKLIAKYDITDSTADYVGYKAEYETLEGQIATLKEKLDAIVEDDSNINADFVSARAIYVAFRANQKTAFRAAEKEVTYNEIDCANYGEIYDAVNAKNADVYEIAGQFIVRINELGGYVFTQELYEQVTALIADINAAGEAVKNAVTNYYIIDSEVEGALGYKQRFEAELATADGWKELAEALKFEDAEDEDYRVTYEYIVTDIKEVIDEWNALANTVQDMVQLNNSGNSYLNAYINTQIALSLYDTVAGEEGLFETAKTDIQAIPDLTDGANRPAVGEQTTQFAAKVEAAKIAYEELKKGVTIITVYEEDYEVKFDLSDAKLLFTEEDAELYADYQNYLVALDLNEVYGVEADIEALYTAGDNTYETAVEDITLSDKDAIEAVNEDVAALGDRKSEIRDYYSTKLTNANKALAELSASLDAWRLQVARIFDKTLPETVPTEEEELATFRTTLAAVLATEDISSLITISTTEIKVLMANYVVLTDATSYAENDGTLLAEKVYLKDGRLFLELIKVREAELIEDLTAKVKTIIDAYPEFSASDMATIKEVEETYAQLTDGEDEQKDRLNQALAADDYDYADFVFAANTYHFTVYFAEAVNDLDAQVAADYYTVEGYVNVKTLLSLYSTQDANVQALVGESYAKLNAVDAKYAEYIADENNTLLSYNDIASAIADSILEGGNVKAAIDTAIENAIAASIATVDNVDGNVLAAIKAQIAASIAENGNVKAAITAAVQAAVTELTTTINNLKAALEAKDTALDAKDAELEQAIADAIADYTQKINALKTALEAKDTALDAKDAELEQAIADAIADYTQKINELKAALEAKDAELEGKINAEKEAKDAAVADLQSQIDALSSKTTVIIIVFAIICGALCACVVVLFVLRKKA